MPPRQGTVGRRRKGEPKASAKEFNLGILASLTSVDFAIMLDVCQFPFTTASLNNTNTLAGSIRLGNKMLHLPVMWQPFSSFLIN